MRRVALFSIALAIVIAAACSESADEPDAGAQPIADAGFGSVQPGTGELQFEEITPGRSLELVRGPQAGGAFFGYHIWSAARVQNYPFDVLRVTVLFVEAESGERRAILERNTPLVADGEDKVVYGLAPRIDDCCKLQSKQFIMHVAVESADGPFAENEVRATAGLCLDEDAMPLCP